MINNINQNEKSTKSVIIDLFSVSGEEEFLELFAKEIIKASSSKWEDWANSAKSIFKRLIPKISIGLDPVNDFNLSFDWEELVSHKDEILNLPEQIAATKKIKLIICLDEFQNLATFQNYNTLENQMRAAWQRHKKVTYCLYGSKRHMMADIFNSPSKPFYRFGDIMLLHKISTKNWVKFIVESFANTGKIISETNAELIPAMMKNHSWYVQQLAHYTWQKSAKTVKKDDIQAALNELIYANTPFYQKEIEDLSITQLNLLKAIVKGEKQFTSTAVMQKYRLGTPRNVSKNKQSFLNNDLINEEKGKYEFLDPAFQNWFLKQYFNNDYTI